MFLFKKRFSKKQPASVPVTSAESVQGTDKDTELTLRLISKCIEHLISQLQTVIPEVGRFQQNFVCFDNRIPGWYVDQCGILIEYSHADPDKRMLRVYATYPEDDRMVSHYYKTGTNAELIAYLKNPDLVQNIFDSYADFSKSIQLSD